jgi:hypothetical protein
VQSAVTSLIQSSPGISYPCDCLIEVNRISLFTRQASGWLSMSLLGWLPTRGGFSGNGLGRRCIVEYRRQAHKARQDRHYQ